jgi:hypothetical protein
MKPPAGSLPQSCARQGQPPFTCGHYAEWLHAYFQQGRHWEAQVLLNCQKESQRPWHGSAPIRISVLSMRTPAAFARTDGSSWHARGSMSSRRATRTCCGDADVGDIGRDKGWADFRTGAGMAWRRAGRGESLPRRRPGEPESEPARGNHQHLPV